MVVLGLPHNQCKPEPDGAISQYDTLNHFTRLVPLDVDFIPASYKVDIYSRQWFILLKFFPPL